MTLLRSRGVLNLAVFLEHCLNAADHLTSTVAGTDDILHGVTRFTEIRYLFRKPS